MTYSSSWQILEEFTNGSLTTRYVYSPIYVDALLLRDRDVDANGSLEERIFALQDANYNIIALTDSTGTVIDRMEYKPFGEVTILNDTVDWKHYYQGGRADETTGLVSFRFRWYSPELGRWTQQDPIHFAAGDINIYRALGNDPVNGLDPSGLEVPGLNHGYPLYLGGNINQPLFDLTGTQHTQFHDYFRNNGFGPNGRTGGGIEYDSARTKWRGLTFEQQKRHIKNAFANAGIPESFIDNHINDIMKGASPGSNNSPLRKTGKACYQISQKIIQDSFKITKFLLAMGGIVSISGVTFANDAYVQAGEESGYKIADKIGLMTRLRQSRNDGTLFTDSSFLLRWRDGTVKVQYEMLNGSVWIVVYKVDLNESGRITNIEPYILPGCLPLDSQPGCPLTGRK